MKEYIDPPEYRPMHHGVANMAAVEPTHATSWRTYLSIHTIVPVLLILSFVLFILLEVVHPWVRDHTAFLTAPSGLVEQDPQKTPSSSVPFAKVGQYGAFYARRHAYVITPRWDYTITARVLHFREYYSTANTADLVPFDLGLGWRAMSDPQALRKYFVISHENRFGRMLWFRWRGNGRTVPPEYISEVMSGVHFSNNHIIPANDTVYATIKSMQAGDIVTLKGTLVDVKRPATPDWKWITSVYDRNDPVKENMSADVQEKWTTCDTIYVESATIEKASSISYLFQ